MRCIILTLNDTKTFVCRFVFLDKISYFCRWKKIKTMSNYRKRIPYGMMNFVDVRKDDCYFVDKTRFIPTMEQANKFFFFIRPRRFGKSLTMSMLHHYYDILDKDKFEELYGDLYIGKHPTEERNSYLVIQLNFAVVNAELNNYRRSLDAHCNTEFNYFCDVYADYLPKGLKEEMNKKNGAVEQLDYLYKECKKHDLKIYLFIDEYDHFTNKILSELDAWMNIRAKHTERGISATSSTPSKRAPILPSSVAS